MKKIIYLAILAIAMFATFNANAQSGELSMSNIRTLINANGTLFFNGQNAVFFVPSQGSSSTIYAGQVWIGGLDVNDSLHLAAQQFGQNGADYFTGPVADNYDANYSAKYNRVWYVTKEQIDYHRSHYQDANYQMPEVIANWAGNGNVANGEAPKLAPFIDVNGNGIYEPLLGDYPSIRGDEAIFIIFNDAAGNHTESAGMPLGVEIHAMAYAYNTEAVPNDPNDKNIYISYEIINRSPNDYHNVYVSSWTDIDLGYYADDYIGCDTVRNMYFGYNGDAIDGPGAGAYSGNPPAQGIMFLNHDANSFVYYNNDANPVNGAPQITQDYYNYMRAYWKNGQHITYGDNGTNTTSVDANFMFNGQSALGNWTEETAGNSLGDRRGIMSINVGNFNAGETFHLDIAYPFAKDELANATPYSSVELLKQRADAIKAFYAEDTNSYIEIEIDAISNPAGIILTVPEGYHSYEWFVNYGNLPENELYLIADTATPLYYSTTDEPPVQNWYLLTWNLYNNYGHYYFCKMTCETNDSKDFKVVYASTELNIVDLNGVAETTNDISVYPNPAHKEINITCGEKINSIEVVDLLGKVVYQGNKTTINVSTFARGNYFVRVQTENDTITKKVVVE